MTGTVIAAALAVASGAETPPPLDSAVSYILNYGVLGVVALAFAFRFVVPRSAVEDAEARARADLIKEQERILLEKSRAEEQRDEALRIAQVQLVPLLGQFTSTTAALIPLLQEIVRTREGHGGGRTR